MKRWTLLAAGLSLTTALGAYDWPGTDLSVIKTFGQSAQGRVIAGVEAQTALPNLSAPDDGDVVFVFRSDRQAVQNLPSALGGFVALAHADNLRTVTTRISPLVDEGQKSFRRGEPLGQVEVDTGAAVSRHRVFVFDQQLGELVNPLLVFPALPDQRPPVVYDVRVVPEAGTEAVSLFGLSSLAVGYWTLQVSVSDPVATGIPGGERGPEGQRGVYAVEAYLNGTEIFNTALDSVQSKDGRWQVKGMGVFLDEVLIGDQGWNLGQVFFNQGTNILEIVVRDYQGNQAGKTFRILGTRAP